VRKPLSSNGASKFIGKEQLLKLRRKAIRAGVWFRVLPRIDRVLVDLTIRVARRIRSASLVRSLLSVARKLEGLLESRFARAVREIGFSLSCRLSLLAQKWGNKGARAWAGDEDFARYLAVMKLNG
jgi:hypothetical protein